MHSLQASSRSGRAVNMHSSDSIKQDEHHDELSSNCGKSTAPFSSNLNVPDNCSVTQDNSPLPPPASTEEEDILLLQNEPYIYGPLTVDYGYNLKCFPLPLLKLHISLLTKDFDRIGADVNINPNTTFLDTLPITIGARTLIGPNCAFYAGTHPLSPSLRNGTHGPELGKAIEVGEDCWIGGSVVVCPGVKIGRGVTVGAGSVVVKDVEDFVVVVGNPARVVRRLEWVSDDESR